MDKVCYSCHYDAETGFVKKPSINPYRTAQCFSCHNGHGSDRGKTAQGAGPKLCAQCHGDLMKEVKDNIVHPPFGKGLCMGCHTPHASNNDGMIVKNQSVLCLAAIQPE